MKEFVFFLFKELLQTHRSAYNRLGKVNSSGDVLTYKQGKNDFEIYFPVKNLPFFSSTKSY